ncbi:unnamed protein product [Phytophthora fragariaefolia]|uniref:Unnamed protein product n=1 Tax=Phytophthora fragariaefolia TaxID=1490495 RepID=A0A9W6XW22_9STRA|nr:unnamed protein product [Phytophthora fragariaefolia]
MTAGKKEGMRKGGRGKKRGAPVRQSRRSQGLPPEEQKNLDDVVREARKASAAKRKATKGEKEMSSAEARPAPEPAALDAHQVPKGDNSGGRLTQPKAVEGESVQDEPAQASERGSNVEVSLDVDRVPDSQLPGQDVGLLDEALELAEEKPLSTVQEDAVLEDLNVSSHRRPKAEVLTETAQVIESGLTSSSPDLDVRPGSHDVVAWDPRWSEQAAKAYVAREVSRWEQVRSERVSPPSVEYVWSEHHPDSLPWLSAILEVSKFLDDRATLNDPVQSWITELNLGRRDLALARDLTAVQIPVELCTAREYVAILQTLHVEAGFQFDNLIPEWFMTTASIVMVNSVRESVRHMLRLLAVELIEWWSERSSRSYQVWTEDLLTSLPLVLPSSRSSRMKSVEDARTSSSQDADTLPSQVGTTDGSSLAATTSGSYASRNSSSGSSLAALGHSAASHMQYAGYGPMVMFAQASGSVVGGGEMGFYVTRETIPERRLRPRSTKTTSSCRGLCRRLVLRRPELALPGRTGNIVIPAEVRRRATRTDSGSMGFRSERTSVSRRFGRSRVSAMSGTAELTVSTLHKLHETLSTLESKNSTDKLTKQEAESKRKLDETERQIHEAERRAQEAERRFREASAQATVAQEVPVQ